MASACSYKQDNFFEGTEKLLEVWFSSTATSADVLDHDLRNIDRSCWEKLLKHVRCEIISVKEEKDMVAYVLSESSMFVSKNRFILKTCGTTTLLHAVRPLMELVKVKCGMDRVDDLFYSRKKFAKPELQHSVHRTFDDEVTHLDELFENGAAYALGRINADCWYLYTIDHVGVEQPDQTLEHLLMQDLDQKMMHLFTKSCSQSAAEATKKSGIAELLPGTVIDDFLFDPCGYSMNGILPNGQYFTIHITPEPECSYVSFETNVPMKSYRELILKVLGIFNPGRFLMTLFANSGSVANQIYKDLRDESFFEGYRRSDHQYCQFKNYQLTYTHYNTLRSRVKAPAPPI